MIRCEVIESTFSRIEADRPHGFSREVAVGRRDPFAIH